MYEYQTERPKILTDDGQRQFLKVRDTVKRLLRQGGAVRMIDATSGTGGDSWLQMAMIDRLVELGEIREITPANVHGQDRVFVEA